MDEPTLWIVGDWRRSEFAPALDLLRRRADCHYCDDLGSGPSEVASLARKGNPRAILLVQSCPGQFSASDAERLHAVAPLARLVALVGPWCEGEIRSGRPWPGIVRVPWRSWRSRLLAALGLHWGSDCPAAPLPRTASEVEQIERSLLPIAHTRRFAGSSLIFTTSRTTSLSISDALEAIGIHCRWQCSPDTAVAAPVDLLVFDGWQQVLSDHDRASADNSVFPRQLVLLHFPRPADLDRAAELGIDAILAQPLLLTELSAALQDLDLRSVVRGGVSVS